MRTRRLAAVLVLALGASVVAATAATGAPAQIDDLREQAAELQDQIEANGAEVARLGEQLNAAQIRVDEAAAQIAEAEESIRVAEARIIELQALVADRAAAVYRTAGTSGPLESIDVDNIEDAGTRFKYTAVAAARDEALIDDLAAATEDLERQRAEASTARDQASQERDELAAAKDAADGAAAEQQALLDQVNGEIADYVAEERARREAAAAAAAATTVATPAPAASAPAPLGPPPAVGGGAGAAVGYAWAQVGKPYCYAGSGPDCYDCSGLTMMAWAQGGISMPHYSGAQGSMFPAVPLDQLQPGDLITTSSWSAHVGIWVGGGYVHATHTGDFIRFVPGSGSVNAAVRPG